MSSLSPLAPQADIEFLEKCLEAESGVFPERVTVDNIPVDAFVTRDDLFKRLIYEVKKPEKALFFALNVHNANMSAKHPPLKSLFHQADVVYCDGAGIKLGAAIQNQGRIPQRYANADWLFTMFDYLAEHGCTIYYLGGEPHVVEKGVALYTATRPQHNIVGFHHGYILEDPAQEQRVMDDINRLKPDVLFVGFGCPLQEFWIAKHMAQLDVRLFYPIGASFDYITGKTPRCPVWLGNLGLEWLFRLTAEPKRLFQRYIFGNPEFLLRLIKNTYLKRPPRTQNAFSANAISLNSG